jgi:hypothetical protein
MLTEKQSAELWEESELLSERAAAETLPEDGSHYGHLKAAQAWLNEYCRNNKVSGKVHKLTSELLDVMSEEGWIV